MTTWNPSDAPLTIDSYVAPVKRHDHDHGSNVLFVQAPTDPTVVSLHAVLRDLVNSNGHFGTLPDEVRQQGIQDVGILIKSITGINPLVVLSV